MESEILNDLFPALCRAAIAIQKPSVLQKQLAEQLGISEGLLSLMLTGKKPIPKETRIKLVMKLNLHPLLDSVSRYLMENCPSAY
jgi:hypothetical protein